MTRLEEEIAKAITPTEVFQPRDFNGNVMVFEKDDHWPNVARLAAEVSKRHIKKAFHANPALKVQELCGMTTEEKLLEQWLKNNGITE